MRLLRRSDTGEFSLTEFPDEAVPPYAILLHTWGAGTEEVTFEDLINCTGKHKPGYEKIRFCGDRAVLNNLEYFWIDTCCINKANYIELSQAINSMYRWYSNATQCYVYLSDVSTTSIASKKKWIEHMLSLFNWRKIVRTLQELLAPSSVEFFFREGIFDVEIPLFYGEGAAIAFKRLRKVIDKREKCIQELRPSNPRDDKKCIK
ncbi:hypothetical protein CC78DRAFT_545259 [Lojkania enalia]|uniref:Heterokaryon incompatibility domain-containing protein n=1 Tax=Lojkania enalia TaxID=147567 RepID=A0A9P4K5K0_9PLEO|nr:hypothetical protein CC78DRAFT_545259 [Didymosphaeria enalia]